MKTKHPLLAFFLLATLLHLPNASNAYDVQTILRDWVNRDKSKADFIKKYGIVDTTALIICMEASEMNERGQASALSDNYEHKLVWIERVREMLSERAKAGGEDFTHKSAALVEHAIKRSKEFMCPPFY